MKHHPSSLLMLLFAVASVSALSTAQAAVTFEKHDYAVKKKPSTAVVADLNGDARPDVAVVSSRSKSVSILLGQPDGTLAAGPRYGAGSAPWSVVAADLTGDGILDLAITNLSGVRVLSGLPGGAFHKEPEYKMHSPFFGIVAADLNADAKTDLAVTLLHFTWDWDMFKVTLRAAYYVQVRYWQPGDRLSAATNYRVGDGAMSVAAGDFNGDTLVDLAVVNNRDDDVSVLNGQALGFALRVDTPVGHRPYRAAAADFNADGVSDLAVTNSADDTVTVLYGSPAGLAGRADYAAGELPTIVAAADFNGDTFLDLAISNKAGFSILYGQPGGTFGDKTDYATNETPTGLAAGDVDGDGMPDIVVTNWRAASISVFLNQGE